MAIWNRALSAGEVAQLYTAGSVLGLPWVDISLGGTDITSYVNAAEGGTTLTYTRGANFDGSSESPGSAVVTVQNFGKVFNPANSGSPLASVLKIGKEVRATAMYGAAGSVVTYPLFHGYLRRVVPGDNNFAELHCQDALYRYGRFETSVAYVSRSINAFRAAILTDVGEATTGLATGSGPEAAVALSGADQRDALSLLSELNQATGSVHYIKPTSTTYDPNVKSSQSIPPGTYCSISVSTTNGKLTLTPGGNYIIKGGSLSVGGGATLTGLGVTIVLTGSGANYATVNLQGGSTVTLTAPTTGATAGMAFFQDRNAPASGTNSFNGGTGQSITGALYFPKQTVKFGGGTTANITCIEIVARAVTFTGNATLKLDCSGTGVLSIGGGGQPAMAE